MRHRTDWEENKAAIEILINAGWGYIRLAHHFGVHPVTMRNAVKRLGLKTKNEIPSQIVAKKPTEYHLTLRLVDPKGYYA